MSERTSYRIELTDFERRVALDALLSFGNLQDPFGFDGNTMVSDSDHREGLEHFCEFLEECSCYCKHDLETRESLKHRVEIGDYTQEEADRYADAFVYIADTRKVPAGRSRQSCILKASSDVGDVAGINRCRPHLNKCFSLARLRNRDFFDSQYRRRSKPRKT